MAIDAGFKRSSPTARLDSFLTTSKYQFVELNAETPAGAAYSEILADVFLEIPLVKKFQERWRLERFHSRERLLETLVACHREGGARAEKPSIAIVDYEEVPTRTEHHMYREFFESRGHTAVVCDPRHLTYEGGKLRHGDTVIDIVYKRLLVNELLDRIDELQPLVRAVKDRATTLVNPFKCKPLHKKAIFAVLTDDDLQGLFTEEEQKAIRAHVPWTRRVSEGKTTRDGKTVDLPALIRAERDRLVMKPNDEYGGKGVFIGWEMSDTEWERALATALEASYVVQEKVELRRRSFPELGPSGLAFRDLVVDLDPYLFNGEVEGFLTRLSGTSLANVTSGGGQVPSFLVEPAASEPRPAAWRAACLQQLRDELDLDGRQRLRDRAALLGVAGQLLELRGVDAGHLALVLELDLGDREARVALHQVDLRVVVTLFAVKPASESCPESAIEKQPAWAAAISSSGFVPFASSKRDEKE